MTQISQFKLVQYYL